MQEDFTEVVEITNDTHGTFDVIVPLGMEDNDIKERLKSLDLNILLGIPEDKKKEVGETDWRRIQEWENSIQSGLRNDKWFSHDVSASETSIAYGHNLTADELNSGIININGKDVNWKKGLTRPQANDLLVQDAEWAKQIALASLSKADLHTNPNAVASLTSVIYNVGSGNWEKSQAKKALEAGHIEDFMHEAFDPVEGFVRIDGKVSRGLVRRRREEAQLFSEGYEGKSNSFRNTMSEIAAALNPISTAQASTLKSTDKMFVPPQSSDIHTIVSGDTLSKIAKDNNTTVSALKELNPQIKDVNKIGIGDKINLNTQQPEESSLQAGETIDVDSINEALSQFKPGKEGFEGTISGGIAAELGKAMMFIGNFMTGRKEATVKNTFNATSAMMTGSLLGSAPKGALRSGLPLRNKGKTREEVAIQGGPLNKKLNENKITNILDDHRVNWEHGENGGITAFSEGVTKAGKVITERKHFKDNTSLRTIRNWLGYSVAGAAVIGGNETEAEAETLTHTVVSGDSLFKIAKDNNTTVSALKELNKISDVNKIGIGDKINLPIPPINSTTEKKILVGAEVPAKEFFSAKTKEQAKTALTRLIMHFTPVNLLPQNVEMMVTDLFFKNFLGAPLGGAVLTENDLEFQLLDLTKKLAIKAIVKGRSEVKYQHYPKTRRGLDALSIVGGKGVAKADKMYDISVSGLAKLAWDSITDPVVTLATTLGGFTLVEEDGIWYATDTYDAEKYASGFSGSKGGYGMMRNLYDRFGTSENQKDEKDKITWKIRLGTKEELMKLMPK